MKKTASETPTINLALEQFLKELDMNQAAFGRAIGVERATINGWIRKGKKPSVPLFMKMANCFEKNPEQLNKRLGFNLDLSEAQETVDTATLASRIENLEAQVKELKAQAA